MPYEVAFLKTLEVGEPERYINECCWGGDIVTERLVPTISMRYERVLTNQEDWGWFIWFRKGDVALAVDVFCDDPSAGTFRAHLTSRRKRWLFPDQITDGPELDDLRRLVVDELEAWTGTRCTVRRLDSNYMPVADESSEPGP
jgi:hypothetical protein